MAFTLIRSGRIASNLIKRNSVNRISFVKTNNRQLSLTALRLTKDDEDMDDLVKNPYYSKYADKIAKLQKTSPEEFLNRLAETEKNKKKAKQAENQGVEEKEFSLPSQPKKKISSSSGMLKEKRLDSIMKTELLKDKSKDEITEIWREYHRNKDCVSAVIPAATFEEMKKRFEEFNTFLFPLPRKQGYEFVVVQFSGNEAHFTTLINFQAYHENAPECLTIVHYPELAEEKGIVLMVGEFDKNVLTQEESSCLGVQLLLYYSQNLIDPNPESSLKRLGHLKRFQYETDIFNHLDLIAELEFTQHIPLANNFLKNEE